MNVEMTFTWQMPGLGYPACANQHSTGMVCHNNIEWIIKVWVLLRCGSALLRWRNQFLHIKAEKSFFRLQCKQFTVNLISGSEAHMHRSDHPVNLFADAYVVSCIVWDFYITVCGESRRRNTLWFGLLHLLTAGTVQHIVSLTCIQYALQ